ncbi:cytochrome P450 [Penicillium samsonianum]|uniref:cytochrome P450 n=1 Tax=Penicillium samsonianum TaxID=1882272 RepID=UPI002547E5F0|nr:cytochrome P450 [Penicillium samsonianum]KAJ6132004.1 cytochrome P450 [Penicillium samsonianum]
MKAPFTHLSLNLTIMTLGQILAIPVALLVVYICIRIGSIRRQFRDLPKPPHHAFLGHFPILLRELRTLPRDIFLPLVVDLVRRKFDLPAVFFLDLYPLFNPIVFISDPGLARKVTQEDRSLRYPGVFETLYPAIPTRWFRTVADRAWTKWHPVVGVSFTAAHFVRMVPQMAEDLQAMLDQLNDWSDRDQIFCMERVATDAILAMTGRAYFGMELDCFAPKSQWTSAFRAATTPVVAARNPLRKPFVLPSWKRHARTFHAMIREKVQHAFDKDEDHGAGVPSLLVSSFAVYRKNGFPEFPRVSEELLSTEYLEELTSTGAAFLIGATSGASVISYAFLLLHQHPDILDDLRREHGQVCGLNRQSILLALQSRPRLLNDLKLTHAVLKETLRLFPMGPVLRKCPSETMEYEGRTYDIRNHIVAISHNSLHRRPDLFPDPDAFNPYRFLPGAVIPIPADAWRPFEKGNGYCVGQELAMIQMKVMLLLTLTEFDFQPKYAQKAARGPDIYGGYAYTTGSGIGPTPAGGLPMRVDKRVK